MTKRKKMSACGGQGPWAGGGPMPGGAPWAGGPWAGGPLPGGPWPGGAPMGGPVAGAVSPCSTAYGPVANICQSAIPVTRMVPVTEQIPVTTVTPLPNPITPQATVGGVPVGGVPSFGKGAAPFGKPTVPFGKGMAPPVVAPMVPVPGFMPGIYTTDAWITGV